MCCNGFKRDKLNKRYRVTRLPHDVLQLGVFRVVAQHGAAVRVRVRDAGERTGRPRRRARDHAQPDVVEEVRPGVVRPVRDSRLAQPPERHLDAVNGEPSVSRASIQLTVA